MSNTVAKAATVPEASTSGGTSDARFFKGVCPVAEFGLVGDTMIKVLEERGFPVSELFPLASNRSLNMFAEMQCAARRHPDVAPQTLLEMATLNPAKAIGLGGKLGEIRIGAEADLIAIPYAGPSENSLEAIIHHSGPVDWTMVGGRTRISDQYSVEN